MTSARRRLLIATGSRHKFEELSALLDLPATDLFALADLGLSDSAVEDGTSFEQNATIKALHYCALSGLTTLADDSGIEVDALDGRPGVWTRRFAGPDATDEQNNVLLLTELEGVPPTDRTARYRCVLVLSEGDALLETTTGVFEGRIAAAARGTAGFGYDPIFEPAGEPPGGRTVGQLSAHEKNAISHRAKAARQMRGRLIARGY